MLFLIEDSLLLERLLGPPRGIHLRLGGVQEGSGLGAGPGFRWNTSTMDFRASAAGSLKKYFIAEGGVRFPGPSTTRSLRFAAGLSSTSTRGGVIIRRRISSVSALTALEDRSNYRILDTFVRVTPGFRVGRTLSAGVNVGYLDPVTGVRHGHTDAVDRRRLRSGDAAGLRGAADVHHVRALRGDQDDRPALQRDVRRPLSLQLQPL